MNPTASIKPLALAVFVGTRGRGSNLMALHAAVQEGRLSARIVAVIGSKEDAPALVRAREAGMQTYIVDPKRQEDDSRYGDALLTVLRAAGADTIGLAGYLRRLPSTVVAAFRDRIVNIHPALLPAFGGKGMYGEHVHRAVLEHGVKVTGCTVHFVDEAYDTGPIILQKVVPIEEGDTPETLAARILPHEHAAYIEALQLLAENRLTVEGRIVHVLPRR
jgi:formyltetrahydrofolate-dependent phosphoribosylglycinamide formyltransferase